MKYGMLLVLAVPLILASGCSNTVQGVQQDTTNDAPLVKAAIQQVSQSAVQAGKVTDKKVSAGLDTLDRDTHLALIATQIKAKFIANKDLDNTANLITVKSSPTAIALTGHVINPAFKVEADSIAQGVIVKDHAGVPLSDQLTVAPG